MGHSSGGTLVEALGFSKYQILSCLAAENILFFSSVDPDLKLFQQIIVLSGTGMFGFYDLLVDNSFIISEKLGVNKLKYVLLNKSNFVSVFQRHTGRAHRRKYC